MRGARSRWLRSPRCRAGAVIIAVLGLLAVGCSWRGPATSAIRSNDELAAAWWSWAASEPDSTNPVVDDTGADCARNQPSDVWFLAGNFGGTTARACSVPQGRDLFFPVLNAMCAEGEGCENWFDGAYVRAQLDGSNLDVFEIDAGPVVVTAVEGNTVTMAGGEFSAFVSGWWVLLSAPASGAHTLSIEGRSIDGFSVDVTYSLVIE